MHVYYIMGVYLRVVCTSDAVLSMCNGVELLRHVINKLTPLVCDEDIRASITTHPDLFFKDNVGMYNQLQTPSYKLIPYGIDELCHANCTFVG